MPDMLRSNSDLATIEASEAGLPFASALIVISIIVRLGILAWAAWVLAARDGFAAGNSGAGEQVLASRCAAKAGLNYIGQSRYTRAARFKNGVCEGLR